MDFRTKSGRTQACPFTTEFFKPDPKPDLTRRLNRSNQKWAT